MILAIAMVDLALWLLAIRDLRAPLVCAALPWFAVALLGFVTERWGREIRIGRGNGYWLGAREATTALSLIFASPATVLAGTFAGAVAGQTFRLWRTPVKVAFNVLLGMLDTEIALLVVGPLAGHGRLSPTVMAALIGCGLLESAVSGLLSTLVITLAEDSRLRTSLPLLGMSIGFGLIFSASSASIGVLIGWVILNSPAFIPLTAPLMVLSAASLCTYRRERMRRRRAVRLYTMAQDLLGVADVEAAVVVVARAAADILEVAEVTVLLWPQGSEQDGLVCQLGTGTAFVRPAIPSDATEAEAHALRLALGARDAPLGVLIANPTGAVARAAAAEIEALAIHAGVAISQRRLARELTFLAYHDPLTGLANRRSFTDAVRLALTEPGPRLAVLLCDLDGFKGVNDAYGHPVGDALLCEVAARMGALLEEDDLLSRWGGDEFAILLRGDNVDRRSGATARQLITLWNQPYGGGQPVSMGMSIGIAHGGGATSVDELLSHADLALYRAKEQGKSSHAVYQAPMAGQARIRERTRSDLQRGLAHGEVEVWYQPIVSTREGRVEGVEALARWQHPDDGLRGADRFIAVAEECGLIGELGQRVLGEACNQAQRWAERLGERAPGYVAVNVAAQQLLCADFVGTVVRAVRTANVDPRRVCLEITETGLLRDLDRASEQITALRAMGVRVALDDFGTGSSSIAYLRRLPIDMVKVDQSIVRGAAGSDDGGRVLRAVVQLIDACHHHVVAEGVETAADYAAVAELGISSWQGHLHARAMSATALEAHLVGGMRAPARSPGGRVGGNVAVA